MNKIYIYLDRLKERLLRYYRREVFLKRINSKSTNINVLGKIHLNATNIKIGNNVNIYPGVYLWGDGEIIIGDNVDIGIGTIIFSKKRVYIGNNTNIAGQCYIIDSNHSINKNQLIREQKLDYNEEGLFIGDDVWIAAGCKIVKGAKINDGSVIGALSLVNSEIVSNGVAVGIPAKVVKNRE